FPATSDRFATRFGRKICDDSIDRVVTSAIAAVRSSEFARSPIRSASEKPIGTNSTTFWGKSTGELGVRAKLSRYSRQLSAWTQRKVNGHSVSRSTAAYASATRIHR